MPLVHCGHDPLVTGPRIRSGGSPASMALRWSRITSLSRAAQDIAQPRQFRAQRVGHGVANSGRKVARALRSRRVAKRIWWIASGSSARPLRQARVCSVRTIVRSCPALAATATASWSTRTSRSPRCPSTSMSRHRWSGLTCAPPTRRSSACSLTNSGYTSWPWKTRSTRTSAPSSTDTRTTRCCRRTQPDSSPTRRSSSPVRSRPSSLRALVTVRKDEAFDMDAVVARWDGSPDLAEKRRRVPLTGCSIMSSTATSKRCSPSTGRSRGWKTSFSMTSSTEQRGAARRSFELREPGHCSAAWCCRCARSSTPCCAGT